MPRDKTISHLRVLEAAKQEFLEKGFEGASIRAIGLKAGMTSAGLYRHCKDKEDLFSQVVGPVISEMDDWLQEHARKQMDFLNTGVTGRQMELLKNGTGEMTEAKAQMAFGENVRLC